jgi:hypothetical protein
MPLLQLQLAEVIFLRVNSCAVVRKHWRNLKLLTDKVACVRKEILAIAIVIVIVIVTITGG